MNLPGKPLRRRAETCSPIAAGRKQTSCDLMLPCDTAKPQRLFKLTRVMTSFMYILFAVSTVSNADLHAYFPRALTNYMKLIAAD